jgi:imidazolonepropionase-like amidohydrolase
MNLAFLLLLLPFQAADSATVAIRAGEVRTVSGGAIESGVILVRDGKISGVAMGLKIPPGAEVIDLGPKSVVTPGFIDAHSHLASSRDVEEWTEAVTPQVHALDAFASHHPDATAAVRSGVTLVSIAPGPGNLVAGRTGLVRFAGPRFDHMIFRNPDGWKIGLTGEVLRSDRKPTSVSGSLRWLRELLSGKVGQEINRTNRRVFLDARSVREIDEAIRLRKEFDLDAVLLHADESSRAIPAIRKSGIPVVLSPLGISDSVEYLSTPAKLAGAGIRFAFASDAPLTRESYLRLSASLAMRHGLGREDALRALTLSAAEILGVDKEVGSVEVGKLADLVIFDGDPLRLSSDVLLVMVGGKVVYQRNRK